MAPSLCGWHHAYRGKGYRAVGSARSGRRRYVYVGVIHHISDPESFEAAEERALKAGLPTS